MIGYIWTRESNVYDEEKYSIKSQLDACREAARADGVEVVADREFEVQFSGRDLHAIPELRELCETLALNRHERQRVYCYTQDRLIRGEEAFDIFYLLVTFRRLNAEVKFIRNPVDLKTIAGQIMALVAGHEASGEIEKIRDRTMRGKLQRVREGKLPNYGMDKFGYRRDRETGKAEINPEEWERLLRIKRLFLDERFSANEIASLFNREGVPTPMKLKRESNASAKTLKRSRNSRWWHSMITRLLRDEAYTGTGHALKLVAKSYNSTGTRKRAREEWIEIPGAYPPLFTPAEWERLQALIGANDCKRKKVGKTPGMLRGLITCGLCKGPLYPTWSGRTRADGSRYLYYVCGYGAGVKGAHPGNYNRVRIPEFDAWAWGEFCEWIRRDASPGDLEKFRKDSASARSTVERLKAERAEAETAIRAKERQLGNLLSLARGATPAVGKLLSAEIEQVEAERAAIEERLRGVGRRIEDEILRKNSIDRNPETREEIVASLSAADPERKRQTLKLFNVRVVVNGSERRFEIAPDLSDDIERRRAA